MGQIDPKHLMSAQEVVASSLSGSSISVVFDAESPYVDLANKVIHLRPVPDHLPPDVVEDIRGDCDHETGHILFTDAQALKSVSRPLIHKVAEAIEDGRIERLIGKEWLGCGENLVGSTKRAVARISSSSNSSEANRRARVLCVLSLISSGWTVEDALLALGQDLSSYVREVCALLDRIPRCETTSDVIQLSEEIVDKWNWVGNDDNCCMESSLVRELNLATCSPAIERKCFVATVGTTENIFTYRAKTDNDKTELIKRPSFDISSLYGVFFDGVYKTASVLRRRMMSKFKSTGYVVRHHQKRGRIDDRNLWKFGLKDERLYSRRVRSFVNTAIVTVVVDCSASMTKSAREPAYEGEPLVFRTRLFTASRSAAAVSSVLDSVGISNEVLAFTTSRKAPIPDPAFDRIRPLRHLIVKPYNRPFCSCRSNFVSLAFFEHCSENIDGESLLWAAKRVLSKPNRVGRPVLIVFSDGEPASHPENSDVLSRHLKVALEKIERAGIDVFGNGIGSESVCRFYKNWSVINDINDLPVSFYKLIDKVLQERRTLRV